ncbi:zinc transport system substrate-binding protein [Nocardioides luteus]|uniref:Zinc ABC transporter substrate-binding protein n=1 Tax=Nocardioides luteus TaxID=1844 RepID=A0ABQ5T109_9ACTN|nr:metal ABC transporter substrate-binding protein [Nocardioides luteus]MDR7311504.1 zinc transport system substrate-binding protein [Nocardioides luteus]GGR55164.1 zinc ABC transporter substrate-binding protein [Nocardioides luteus]GLJ70153.1 zinc ABC transporter substrate-binding protein [Nocardioides luteus]
MTPTSRSAALLAAGALLLTSGCAALSEDASGDSGSGKVQVAAAFYPLEFVAERVAGDLAEVTGLTKPGVEPHDLELSINQTAALQTADVILTEHGFQPAIDDAVEQDVKGTIVDVEKSVELRAAEETEDDHGHDEEGHDHGDIDPHFWHDPVLMADYAEDVRAALAKADPDNADAYATNAKALTQDLTEVDQEFETGLAKCRIKEVVVSHDAFAYLARYGLEFESIAGLTPDAEPNPAQLAEIGEHAKEHEVTTIFSERLVSTALAETLAGDLGLKTAVLDPIEGLSAETEGEDYLSLMRQNLDALKAANGCQ